MNICIIISLTSLLILGGSGLFFEYVVYSSILLFLIILIFLRLKSGRVTFPPLFYEFRLILAALLASTLWSVDKQQTILFSTIYISGCMLWLIVYNLKNRIDFNKIIYFTTAAYTILFLYQLYFSRTVRFDYSSVIYPSFQNNFHIGDWWAVFLIIPAAVIITEKFGTVKFFLNLIQILVGVVVILISHSRSAVIALVLGLSFLLLKSKISNKIRKNIAVVIPLSALFIYFSLTKSVFGNRPYIWQSLAGFVIHPFGVGFGNFGEISRQFTIDKLGFRDIAAYSHSLPFEFISGIGIMSVLVGYWFIKFMRMINKGEAVKGAMVITLLVCFSADATYLVLSMIWLLFILMGISDQNLDKS